MKSYSQQASISVPSLAAHLYHLHWNKHLKGPFLFKKRLLPHATRVQEKKKKEISSESRGLLPPPRPHSYLFEARIPGTVAGTFHKSSPWITSIPLGSFYHTQVLPPLLF